MATPWNSIKESIVSQESGRVLGHSDALASPCMSCDTAPCCTHLPLNTFKVTNLVELDHARYILNFDRIELGISSSGSWSAYYAFPCRFLDRDTFCCTVHDTPAQPRICVHYNPYNCWYKRVFTLGQNEDMVRIDYDRMQYLLQFITFDEQRKITSVPAWDDLIQLMQNFDDKKSESYQEPSFDDAALTAWEKLVLNPSSDELPQVEPLAYDSTYDPCTGCAAYCCKTLVFPQSLPHHISNLDYYQFCLGFPGVELGISDGGWSTLVKTTCRHLTKDNRCSLYGKAERPLICKYYDAWKCDYKPQFGKARPTGFMRVRLEQFSWLTECISSDSEGNILAIPPQEAIRQYIEEKWRDSKISSGSTG